MKAPVATCLALAGLGFTTTQAHAVEPLDTFSARLGGYITQFDTQIRADGQTQRGNQIDLDKDLGLGQGNAIAYVGLTWRPWNDHEFGLAYYQDDASADRQIHRDFEFRGDLYTSDTTVHSERALDTYEAYYVWWAANNPTWTLGPRVGLVWYRIDLSLERTRNPDGTPVVNTFRDEVSADLPVPTLGGSWRYVPGGNTAWRLGADAGWFSLNTSGLNGDVYFGRLGVEWFPWERWGFSLDYTSRRIKVDADKSGFTGNFNFRDSGIRLSGVYRF
jgi:hypothetical protein